MMLSTRAVVVIDRELSNMNDIMDITSTTAKEEGGRDVVIAAMVEEEEDDDDGAVAVLVVENNDSNVVNNDGRINDNNYCMVNIGTLPTSSSSSYDDSNDENEDEGRRERTRGPGGICHDVSVQFIVSIGHVNYTLRP